MDLRVEHDDEPFDPYQWLTDYASHLNAIDQRRWFGFPFFDLLAGAVVWPDATRQWPRRPRTPTEVIWALRHLWAYRTSLMLGQPREELAEYWRFGLEHFPKWVGFHPKRCIATRALLRIHRDGEVRTAQLIEQIKRHTDSTPDQGGGRKEELGY